MDAPMRESVRPEQKPEFCEWQGCSDPYYSRGLCQLHYMRKYKGADMDAPTRSRPVPGVSTRTTKFGYAHIYLPDHPHAQTKAGSTNIGT